MEAEKAWVPLVAGICILSAAALKIIAAVGLATGLALINIVPDIPFEVPRIIILFVVIVPAAILSIIAIIGGIFALRKRSWGMALAGAIAAFLPSSVLGILAIILVAISKKDFK